MSPWVIVAVPSQRESVWKQSSEKRPHLTILFLGEQTDLHAAARISEFVEHASSMLDRFGLSVDRRGVLGDDKADVLFFEKSYVPKSLYDFRASLLQNDDIKKMFDSVEQYPDWTPHLTLGYPETPARNLQNGESDPQWVNFDRIEFWVDDFDGPSFELSSNNDLAHFGVKGMKWGVRRDERALAGNDLALNLAQRTQVRVASGISTLAAVGIASNAAAIGFQLQSKFEKIKALDESYKVMQKNPFIDDAAKETLRGVRNGMVRGLVMSATLTSAVATGIGVITKKSATAYFAPVHKVYKDSKGAINSDIRKLGKDIKSGKHPKMSTKEYNAKVSKIVETHMLKDKSNILSPFHELARNQLGTEYNTKSLKIKFETLPNTDLYDKMTVLTPNGLKLVKAIRKVEHSAMDEDLDLPKVEFHFDYEFDSEGYFSGFSCPTIEMANAILTNDTEGLKDMIDKYENSSESELKHFGVKGMKWGVRRENGSSSADGGLSRPITPPLTSVEVSSARSKLDKTPEHFFSGKAGIREFLAAHKSVLEDAKSGFESRADFDKWYANRNEDFAKVQSDSTDSSVRLRLYGSSRDSPNGYVDASIRGELKHFGVKGMKWGVRRSEAELAATRSEDSETAGELQSRASAAGIGALSNQELKVLTERANLERSYISAISGRDQSGSTNPNQDLQERINRLNLEKQYAALSSERAQKKSNPVLSFAKNLAGQVLKEQATTLVSSTVAKTLAINLEKRGNSVGSKAVLKKSLSGVMDYDDVKKSLGTYKEKADPKKDLKAKVDLLKLESEFKSLNAPPVLKPVDRNESKKRLIDDMKLEKEYRKLLKDLNPEKKFSDPRVKVKKFKKKP